MGSVEEVVKTEGSTTAWPSDGDGARPHAWAWGRDGDRFDGA